MATAGARGGDPAAAAELYRQLATGAESGWDFSSRWTGAPGALGTLRTTRVVPADLNAMLCDMEANLARFAEVRTGDVAPHSWDPAPGCFAMLQPHAVPSSTRAEQGLVTMGRQLQDACGRAAL